MSVRSEAFPYALPGAFGAALAAAAGFPLLAVALAAVALALGAFFRDPELHGLLTWAQQSDDRDERVRYYARAQELIHRMAPWVPLAHSQIAVAARYDLEGLRISPNQKVNYRGVRRTR